MSDFDGSSRRTEDTTAAVAHTAQDKAAQGAGLVGDKATEVAGTARQQASEVAGEATARARGLGNELRDQLQDQAHTQTERLAQNVRRLADELEDMSRKGRPDSSAAGMVGQVADGGHKVAAHLESRGPDGLVSDLQDFARRRPGVFLTGAALAGFAAARVGKGVKATGGSTRTASGPTDTTDTYEQPQPPHLTPSYGGSIAAPGPVRAPDAPLRRPQGS